MSPTRRRWLIALGGLAVLVAVASVVAYAARTVVAERLALSFLDARGFSDASLTVAALDTDRAVVEDVDLGPDGPVVERLIVGYRLGELLDGRVRDVTLTGLVLTIDIDSAEPLGGLGRLAEADGDGAGGAGPPLPHVIVEDATVRLRGVGGGQIAIAADGWVVPEGVNAGAEFSGSVRAAEGDGAFKAVISDPLGRPEAFVEATGRLGVATLPWPTEALPPPSAGTLGFEIVGMLPVPTSGSGITALAGGEAGELSVEFDLTDVVWPKVAESGAANLAMEVRANEGAFHVVLAAPVTVDLDGVDAGALAAIGMPDVGSTVALTVAAPEDGPVAVVSPSGGRWRAELATRLSLALTIGLIDLVVVGDGDLGPAVATPSFHASTLDLNVHEFAYADYALRRLRWSAAGDVAADAVRLAGPLRIDMHRFDVDPWTFEDVSWNGPLRLVHEADRTRLETDDRATLTFGKALDFGPLRLAAPVTATVETATFDRAADATVIAASFGADRLSGHIRRAGEADLGFSARPGSIDLAIRLDDTVATELDLSGAGVDLPSLGLRAAGIAARIPIDGNGDVGPAPVGLTLSHTGDPPAFLPVRLDGAATMRDDKVRLSGTAALAGARVKVPVAGAIDLADGSVAAEFGPADIAFAAGALQPVDLHPGLALLDSAAGGVRVAGDLAIGADGRRSERAEITVENLSFNAAGTVVQSIGGTLELVGFAPLVTPPGQRLTAAAIVSAMTIADVDATFGLVAGGDLPVLAIDRVAGAFAGGRVAIADAVIDLGVERNAVDVLVERLSIAKLIEEWSMEDVRGTGHLSGVIPVRVGPAGVAIDAGRLVAEEAGVLEVGLGAAGETLENQGEQVALMVNALENFHYQVLEIGIDRPPDGALGLDLVLEGHNPDVLEGYPFRFNISLGGELEPVLAALREGQAITSDLLRGAIGGSP